MNRTYTFVVGAGASAEFGFPVGTSLVKDISNLVHFPTDDFGRLKSGNQVLNAAFDLIPHPEEGQRWNKTYLYKVASDIGQNMGLALSIDNYLDAQKEKRGYVPVGKIAISKAILDSERNTSLWFDWRKSANTRPDFASLPKNWLTNVFQILSAKRNLDGFLSALNCIRFVTFNYDRVIEKFFLEATKSYFSISDQEVSEALKNNLNIVHVYGSLGDISGPGAVEFGSSKDYSDVYRASTSINTFTEGISEGNEIQRAQGWIASTDAIIFVGFAFLRINLVALQPARFSKSPRVLGTTLNMSVENEEIAKNFLKHKWFKGVRHKFEFSPIEGNQLISDISGYLAEDDVLD